MPKYLTHLPLTLPPPVHTTTNNHAAAATLTTPVPTPTHTPTPTPTPTPTLTPAAPTGQRPTHNGSHTATALKRLATRLADNQVVISKKLVGLLSTGTGTAQERATSM